MQNYKLKFKIFLISLFTIHSLLFTSSVSASEYVLPYPSFMPGHKLYRLHQLWEKIQGYWHFGNLAKFKYHLKMADKYLVEAKTLFEYKQYFLATQSLSKSSQHFQKTNFFLEKASQEGKDIQQKKALLSSAAEKHREVLNHLLDELPEEFLWQEEKGKGERLKIRQMIEEALERIKPKTKDQK